MDKLPSDVLREVFRQLVPKIPKWEDDFQATITGPLHLSHVSRRWREVSISFGTLWSYLAIQIDDKNTHKHQKAVDICDTWLQRTGQALLNFTVWFDLSKDTAKEVHSACEHIIIALLSTRGRWKDIDLQWMNVELSPGFKGIKLNEMFNVVKLSLETDVNCNGRSEFPLVDVGRSTNIKRLILDSKSVLDFGGAQLSCLQLCELDLPRTSPGKPAPAVYKELLNAAKNLKLLNVHSLYFSETIIPRIGSKDVFVRDIRELRVTGGIFSAYIVNTLQLPKLKTLIYEDDDYPLAGQVILDFMNRSRPPLIHLEITSSEIDEDTLIPILELLPTLIELRLTRCSVSMRLFRAFDAGNSVRWCCMNDEEIDVPLVCPHLSTLHLQQVDILDSADASAHGLLSMFESRSGTSSNKVKIDNDCTVDMPFDREGYHIIKQALENGARIVVEDLEEVYTDLDYGSGSDSYLDSGSDSDSDSDDSCNL